MITRVVVLAIILSSAATYTMREPEPTWDEVLKKFHVAAGEIDILNKTMKALSRENFAKLEVIGKKFEQDFNRVRHVPPATVDQKQFYDLWKTGEEFGAMPEVLITHIAQELGKKQ